MRTADRIAALEDRIAVLEEALGYRAAASSGLTPQQGRIAAVLARRALPTVLLAEVVGTTTVCLRRQICLMRRRGVRVTFQDGAYRLEKIP